MISDCGCHCSPGCCLPVLLRSSSNGRCCQVRPSLFHLHRPSIPYLSDVTTRQSAQWHRHLRMPPSCGCPPVPCRHHRCAVFDDVACRRRNPVPEETHRCRRCGTGRRRTFRRSDRGWKQNTRCATIQRGNDELKTTWSLVAVHSSVIAALGFQVDVSVSLFVVPRARFHPVMRLVVVRFLSWSECGRVVQGSSDNERVYCFKVRYATDCRIARNQTAAAKSVSQTQIQFAKTVATSPSQRRCSHSHVDVSSPPCHVVIQCVTTELPPRSILSSRCVK